MKNQNNFITCKALPFPVPPEAAAVLDACKSVTVATSTSQLVELAVRDQVNGWHEVTYDVPGKGHVVEVRVCRTKNGINANYLEPYMRRRDPNCMVIGDSLPTDKPTYRERFGDGFSSVREETFAWLKTQDLAVFPFYAGMVAKGTHALVIAPANAGFFALGLAMLQGILTANEAPADFAPRAVIDVAPRFRRTHFDARQVVHNRLESAHELFSYNLYPGPSAKKGVYDVLHNIGEAELRITMHCSTVQVITPYDNKIVISQEGASGGGKSEMLEHALRQADGSLLIGHNLANGYKCHLTLPSGCDLRPVTDDMALCQPTLEKGRGKPSLLDAENAWFVRINHMTRYGVDPYLEKLTIHPPEPLFILNVQGHPGATSLIWEYTEDEPCKPRPSPRDIVPSVVQGPVHVDIRSIGVSTPPCNAEAPNYGIVATERMSSEGVGSYWPFATGRDVYHANPLHAAVDHPRIPRPRPAAHRQENHRVLPRRRIPHGL